MLHTPPTPSKQYLDCVLFYDFEEKVIRLLWHQTSIMFLARALKNIPPHFTCSSSWSLFIDMGVATTTDTTDSVRTRFETLKNLYGMSVQVDGTTKRRKCIWYWKNSKINPKVVLFYQQWYFILYCFTAWRCKQNMLHWMDWSKKMQPKSLTWLSSGFGAQLWTWLGLG